MGGSMSSLPTSRPTIELLEFNCRSMVVSAPQDQQDQEQQEQQEQWEKEHQRKNVIWLLRREIDKIFSREGPHSIIVRNIIIEKITEIFCSFSGQQRVDEIISSDKYNEEPLVKTVTTEDPRTDYDGPPIFRIISPTKWTLRQGEEFVVNHTRMGYTGNPILNIRIHIRSVKDP